MLLLAIIILGVVATLFMQTEFGISWRAETVVRVRGGTVSISKGGVLPHVRSNLAGVMQDAGIDHGFIAVMPDKRIVFSRNIRSEWRQRLRNVLLN